MTCFKATRYVTCVLLQLTMWHACCHNSLCDMHAVTWWVTARLSHATHHVTCHACCCLWFDDHVTCKQLTNSRDMRAVCTEHALSHLPFPPLQCTTQLILWTIRQQSCTREQICTWESFGQKYQNFLEYRFVPRYMMIRIWLTKPVVLCPAMGEMLCGIAPAECRQHTSHDVCRQHTSHDVRASIPQAFVFG